MKNTKKDVKNIDIGTKRIGKYFNSRVREQEVGDG